MNEFSETVYIRSKDRADGVRWLEKNELIGYAYEPRGPWVQVLPDWRDDNKLTALKKSSGLVVYYCFAEEQFWSFLVFRNGKRLFSYECIYEIDEYLADGIELDELATILNTSASELDSLLHTGGDDMNWNRHAENAAEIAVLLEFPNYAFVSFDYAHAESGGTGFDEFYYDPDAPEPEEESAPTGGASPGQPPMDAEDAPWQAVYNLASQFLMRLHDEELIELTLDTRLVRDRLIERLTQTVIEHPVSSDSQLLHHWIDNLMEAPEIVDVFATDDMLTDVYERSKKALQTSSADI